MPIYEYECPKCGVFDEMQSIAAEPRKRCPTCRSKVTKLISQTAFHLRGGGWYSDGYEKKNGSSKSSDSSSTSTATSTKSESKTSDAGKSSAPKKKSSGKSSQSAA